MIPSAPGPLPAITPCDESINGFEHVYGWRLHATRKGEKDGDQEDKTERGAEHLGTLQKATDLDGRTAIYLRPVRGVGTIGISGVTTVKSCVHPDIKFGPSGE